MKKYNYHYTTLLTRSRNKNFVGLKDGNGY